MSGRRLAPPVHRQRPSAADRKTTPRVRGRQREADVKEAPGGKAGDFHPCVGRVPSPGGPGRFLRSIGLLVDVCRWPTRSGHALAWRDHRLVIDAIAFKYRTGTPWRDLPEQFGSWKVAHNRLRTWAVDGMWAKAPALLAQADAEGAPATWAKRRTMAATDPSSSLARTSQGACGRGSARLGHAGQVADASRPVTSAATGRGQRWTAGGSAGR
ncbi:transposase [Streptomyces sp. NPDC054865]